MLDKILGIVLSKLGSGPPRLAEGEFALPWRSAPDPAMTTANLWEAQFTDGSHYVTVQLDTVNEWSWILVSSAVGPVAMRCGFPTNEAARKHVERHLGLVA